MSTEWKVNWEVHSTATSPTPLPTMVESEDIPPPIHIVNELNHVPSQTLPNYYDTNNWGDYREDEKEPKEAIDEIYYSDSDNDENSPIEPTTKPSHQLMQSTTIATDTCQPPNDPFAAILPLKEEITKLAIALRDQIRLRQHICGQLARSQSKLQFEQMLVEQQKSLIERLQLKCENSASDCAHAKAYHDNISTFTICNKIILSHTGYVSPDEFHE
jgi:hypothetical protein